MLGMMAEPLTPTLRKQRGRYEFKVSLVYRIARANTVTPCLRGKKENTMFHVQVGERAGM